MPDTAKVVINLATGLDDGERVTVALLVGGALPGYGEAIACDGCPPIARLLEQFADGGGQLLVCPVCFNARKLNEPELVKNARIGGATPLWEWIGDEHTTVFSY
jgi:DsrE/DsrF-like family